MLARERHRRILRSLAGGRTLDLADLARLTGASAPTLRRDLICLSERGLLRRVRGGAEGLDAEKPPHLAGQRAFAASRALRALEKRNIGRLAATLVENGEAVLVDGGTTTHAFAEALAGRPVQVLTNSFPVAELLQRHPRTRVVLPAGELYREQGLLLSPFDTDPFEGWQAGKLFLGAQAVSALGLLQSDSMLVRAERLLIERSVEVIVLVDSSKLGARAPIVLCPLRRVSRLVTDAGITRAQRRMLEAAGVEVIVARERARASSAA